METQTIKQQSETREARAKLILAKGNPEILEDNTWLAFMILILVTAQTSNTTAREKVYTANILRQSFYSRN